MPGKSSLCLVIYLHLLRFVGNTAVVVTVKVQATIEVVDVELRITDSENGGKGKLHELVFNKPAGMQLNEF